METNEERVEPTGTENPRCSQYRECSNKACIFFEGDEPCWARVSPFKLRRRPSLLLRDTAESCLCLSMPCTECGYFKD